MKFLLCVGAEKAGTTWLHNYFSWHPDYHDIGKELNAIQRDDLVPTWPSTDRYKQNLDLFFSEVGNLNKVTGDFTHYEGSTPNIFRLIKGGLKKYDVDVVPVYIMRDPIKRAWSAWNMLGGGCDFHMPKPSFFVIHSMLQCKYKETVEALDSIFARPLYFFYEDFFAQSSVDTICAELEIPNHPANTDLYVNKRHYDSEVPQEFIELFCQTDKNRTAVSFLQERFGNVPWDLSYYR